MAVRVANGWSSASINSHGKLAVLLSSTNTICCIWRAASLKSFGMSNWNKVRLKSAS